MSIAKDAFFNQCEFGLKTHPFFIVVNHFSSGNPMKQGVYNANYMDMISI